MDNKKFIRLVVEKKKEVHLKWEQKLEGAAKAKADAEATERKARAAKLKRKSMSI